MSASTLLSYLCNTANQNIIYFELLVEGFED